MRIYNWRREADGRDKKEEPVFPKIEPFDSFAEARLFADWHDGTKKMVAKRWKARLTAGKAYEGRQREEEEEEEAAATKWEDAQETYQPTHKKMRVELLDS